jgi:hypothetical protein
VRDHRRAPRARARVEDVVEAVDVELFGRVGDVARGRGGDAGTLGRPERGVRGAQGGNVRERRGR